MNIKPEDTKYLLNAIKNDIEILKRRVEAIEEKLTKLFKYEEPTKYYEL